MKFVKKLTALFLAIVMTMAMGITAFAADSTYSITIKGDSGHTYEAYQIFKGDLDSTEKTLSNVKWGDGVDSAKLLAALKADTTYGGDFSNCTTAQDVADVLANTKDAADNSKYKYANDSDALIAISKIIGANLSSPVNKTWTETELSGDDAGKSTYKIEGLAPGYYFVKDKDKSAPSDDAYTRYILQVVKDVNVDAKSEVPEIEKSILEGTTPTKVPANSASIGDEIKYQLDSEVPDMTGYTKYYYIIEDTLSKGLTFDYDATTKTGVTVTIGSTTLNNDNDYTVTETRNQDGTTTIKIVIKSFIKYADQKGNAITVNYSATLNQDAVITDAGNPNTVKLIYSNNPNVTPKGENEPGGDDKDVTGETPESKVVTYTTGLKLVKVDATDKHVLPGAKFQISGMKQDIIIINNEIYKADTNGTYYRLTDGTYTTTAPTTAGLSEEALAKYEKNADDSYTKYSKETEISQEDRKTEFTTEGYVNESGVITFKDLGAGEYTITELVAPDGYNMLKDSIKVKITADAKIDSITWTVQTKNSTESDDKYTAVTTKEDNLYKITVENNKGSILPSTGGMGTTVIYIAGIAMIVAAGVVVIARKRFA